MGSELVVVLVLHDHEDAEVVLAGLRRRLADEVLGVLGVVGVEEAGQLDVVGELA
jgi:hypothetical protein